MNSKLRFVLVLLFGVSLCPGQAKEKPDAILRMPAKDEGIVLKHGDGPEKCDVEGASGPWVFQDDTSVYLSYDGAGPKGRLACLATSDDLVHWTKKGRVLEFGEAGAADSASASGGITYFDGATWHMFYIGGKSASSLPSVPAIATTVLKAHASAPAGPWTKQPEVTPLAHLQQAWTPRFFIVAPGQIIKQGQGYLMFFSVDSAGKTGADHTLGIARTKDLDGAWTIDAQPILPPAENVEGSSLYYEPANQTWFLFTHHLEGGVNGAVWVYWSKDLDHWKAEDKAVVLGNSKSNSTGLSFGAVSVLKYGSRLALFYDALDGSKVRDVGLAWLDLPLTAPKR